MLKEKMCRYCVSGLLVLVTITSLTVRDARAWNKAGHMVTGAIAYRELKTSDPQALNRVISILKEHPFYEERWLPAIEALQSDDPDKEGLFLFMYAARWPDDIRGDPDLHCGNCHFVNFRFRPGQPDPSPVKIGVGEILDAFEENLEIVRSDSPDDEKAMAISWILHLIGDVHQPLHTAALVTSDFPNGDRGGNLFFIRVRSNSRTINLHQFWDGLIIGSERFRSVNNRATGLRSRPEFRRSGLSELSERQFTRWADTESFSAAKQHAYRNGTLQVSTDEDNGAVLPQGYAGVVQPVAERRAVLAGYRIADLLSSVF